MYYLCFLDFEATCNEDNSFPRNQMEIIEFPSILFSIENYKITQQSIFHQYVSFKESFTEVITKMTDLGVQKFNEQSKTLMEKLFTKKFGKSSLVEEYFMKTISHENMVEFSEIPEEVKKVLNLRLDYFHKLESESDTKSSLSSYFT